MSSDKIRNYSFVAELLLKEKKGVTKKEKKDIEEVIKNIILNKKKGEDLIFPDEVLAFFTPLIKNIIKKKMINDKMNGFMHHNDDYSDLIQEAYSGLLYGLSKYDVTKLNAPTTYLHYWIANFVQKSRNNLNNIIKPDSVYHPLYIYVKNHLDNGLNVDQILKFFPKADKKNGEWVYPPEEVKINHLTIKRSTVIKHINHVLNGGKPIAVTQTDENESYIEFEIFNKTKKDSAIDINLGTRNIDLNMYEFKDIIITQLKKIKKFPDNEKNLFIEYFNLGKPVFPMLPNITNEDTLDISIYSSKRKKISKGLYYSLKYDISRNKIKDIINDIIEEIKPVISNYSN